MNLIQNLRDIEKSLNRVYFQTKLKPSQYWKMLQSRTGNSQGTWFKDSLMTNKESRHKSLFHGTFLSVALVSTFLLALHCHLKDLEQAATQAANIPQKQAATMLPPTQWKTTRGTESCFLSADSLGRIEKLAHIGTSASCNNRVICCWSIIPLGEKN